MATTSMAQCNPEMKPTLDSAMPVEFQTLAAAFAQTNVTPEQMQRYLTENRAAISTLATSRCAHMMQTPKQTSHSLTMDMTGAAFMLYAASLRPPDAPGNFGPLLCREDLRLTGFGEVDVDATAGNTGGYIGWLQTIGVNPTTGRLGRTPDGSAINGLRATLE